MGVNKGGRMTEKEMKERHGIDVNVAEKLMKKYGLVDENATKEDVLKELERGLNDEEIKRIMEKPAKTVRGDGNQKIIQQN